MSPSLMAGPLTFPATSLTPPPLKCSAKAGIKRQMGGGLRLYLNQGWKYDF